MIYTTRIIYAGSQSNLEKPHTRIGSNAVAVFFTLARTMISKDKKVLLVSQQRVDIFVSKKKKLTKSSMKLSYSYFTMPLT